MDDDATWIYEWNHHIYKIHPWSLEDPHRKVVHKLEFKVDRVRGFEHILLITNYSSVHYVWDLKHNLLSEWYPDARMNTYENGTKMTYQVFENDTVYVLQ